MSKQIIKNLTIPPSYSSQPTLSSLNSQITNANIIGAGSTTVSVPHLSITGAYSTTGYFKINTPPPYRKLRLFNIEYTLTKKDCPNAFQRWIISTFMGGKWSKKEVALSLKLYTMLLGATIEI